MNLPLFATTLSQAMMQKMAPRYIDLKKIPNHQISRADSVLLHTVNTNKFPLILYIYHKANHYSYSTLNALNLRLWDRKAKFYEDGHKPKHVQAT